MATVDFSKLDKIVESLEVGQFGLNTTNSVVGKIRLFEVDYPGLHWVVQSAPHLSPRVAQCSEIVD